MLTINKVGTVTVAVHMLIGLTMVLAACAQTESRALVDTGPNAGLSNRELVNKAVTNMRQVVSYHMDFSFSVDDGQNPPQQVRLLADVQQPEGWDYATPTAGVFKYAMPAGDWDIIWASDGRLYESRDGGKTWFESPLLLLEVEGIVSGEYIWPLYTEEYWGTREPAGTPASAPLNISFKDGSPRLEKIDGVLTRHVIADVSGVKVHDLLKQPTELDLWVSTDITPTLRKLEVKLNEGTPVADSTQGTPSGTAVSEGVPHTTTWQWSRINEDLGDVKAPAVVEPPPKSAAEETIVAGLAGGAPVVVELSPTEPGSGSELTPTPAKEYHMSRYDLDIKVNTDGSLDIVETLNFVFTSGSFHRGLRTWDRDSIGDITIKGVAENRNSQVKSYTEGNFDPDDSTTGVPGTYGTESTGSELRLRWIFDPTSNDTRIFQLAYHVDGAVRANTYVNRLDWYAVPPRWSSTINQSRVSVTFPEGSDTSTWDVASIPKGAEVSKQGNAIIWSASNGLNDGFEVGVDIPKDALNVNAPPTETIK